jgi:hypothetical protein
VGFLKQELTVSNYLCSAGAAGVAAGALAEDIGACAGAAGAAGAACSAAGAGASSFFLQPAAKATARDRQSAKEISFFIDVFTPFFWIYHYTQSVWFFVSQQRGNILAFREMSILFKGINYTKSLESSLITVCGVGSGYLNKGKVPNLRHFLPNQVFWRSIIGASTTPVCQNRTGCGFARQSMPDDSVKGHVMKRKTLQHSLYKTPT